MHRVTPAKHRLTRLVVAMGALLPVLSPPVLGQDSSAPRLAVSENADLAVLPTRFSQSDIARLREQARGGGDAFIAYPRLILNGRTTSQMLPVQIYGEEVALDTEALAAQGMDIPGADKAKWQTLTDLGIAGRYDNNAQEITLLVPAEWLPHQSLSTGLFLSNTPVTPRR